MENNVTSGNFRIMSGSVLKLIAVISMLIDHTAYALYYDVSFFHTYFGTFAGRDITIYYIMRSIGRLAFPIFCFLVAQGYKKTKNVTAYSFRLLAFALVSEIPFNLMTSDRIWNPQMQNVYFTLFLGVLMLCVYEKISNSLLKMFLMLSLSVVAFYLKADYGLYGVLLILLMYVLKDKPLVQALLAYPLLSGVTEAMVAFIPINMYNGKRGFVKTPVLKYVFYLFYPVHILALFAIRFYLIQQ